MSANEKKKCTAIVLSAGKGSRMGASVHKQYLELAGKPIICHCLQVFEESSVIDDVILVTGSGEEDYVRSEIVEKYHFYKVRKIVAGGRERYDSVWGGLQAVSKEKEASYVFIHDGARPFVDEEMLGRLYHCVEQCSACVAGMPSKDTIKLVDQEDFAIETPERKYVWTVQTPQVFELSLIYEAYSRMMREDCEGITDDAMAVERYMKVPVKMVEGAYRNLKITTPEDMEIAEVFALGKKQKSWD